MELLEITLQVVVAVTGLAGHFYIKKKNHLGYRFWIVGNIAMMAITIEKGMYVTTALFAVYTWIAIEAIKEWGGGIADNHQVSGEQIKNPE